MSQQFSKQQLRQICLKRRDGLSVTERAAYSNTIRSSVISYLLGELKTENHEVSLFLPLRSEVDLTEVLEILGRENLKLSLPVVLDRETIIFRRYTPSTQLVDAGFGTIGPPENASIVDPEIMIMPLAGFDEMGGRIGYGAGHYDRAISRLNLKGIVPVTIGVAFAIQQCDRVPVEPHDVPLEAIVTETKIIKSAKI